MKKVISIHSDEVLVVELENSKKRYEVGDYLGIETKEGFSVDGVISSISPSKVQIATKDSYLEYDFSEIKGIK